MSSVPPPPGGPDRPPRPGLLSADAPRPTLGVEDSVVLPPRAPWWRRLLDLLPGRAWLTLATVLALGVALAVALSSPGDVGRRATTVPTIDFPDFPAFSDLTVPSDVGDLNDPNDVEEVAEVAEVAGAPAGSRGGADEPVAAGAIADIGEGWRLQVLDVVPDATSLVVGADSFNVVPPQGSVFALVRVALGYFGLEDPVTPLLVSLDVFGDGDVALAHDCGVVPDALDLFSRLYAGGVAIGNVCVVADAGDVPRLQIVASGDPLGAHGVTLEAAAPSTTPEPMASLPGPRDGAASTPDRRSPVPIGTRAAVGGGWSVTVDAPATDITSAVLEENEFNVAPPDGFRFIGVGVTFTYDGDSASGSSGDVSSAVSVATTAIGVSNVELASECGVVPDGVDLLQRLRPGGAVSGTICVVAPSDESAPIVLSAGANVASGPVLFATG